ncbi:MAG: membrane protein [Melioribacteraceae bacterium]|nr:MAG: membrane protein [Melioribacteraceae bacterium]
MAQSNTNNARLIFGLILVILGGLFLIENFGFFNFEIPWIIRDNIFSWKTILITIGIVIVSSSKNRMPGYIMIALGLLGFLPELWPLLLIALGLYIMFRRSDIFSSNKNNSFESPDYNGDDYLNDVAVFGGGSKRFHSQNFSGGKLTAIFGGSEIDLRNSHLANGSHSIDILAIFGGTTIIVPYDWNVRVDVIPILGGFSDKRLKDPNKDYTDEKVLTIKGVVIFGGGEVKN